MDVEVNEDVENGNKDRARLVDTLRRKDVSVDGS